MDVEIQTLCTNVQEIHVRDGGHATHWKLSQVRYITSASSSHIAIALCIYHILQIIVPEWTKASILIASFGMVVAESSEQSDERSIYVGNVDYAVTPDELQSFFGSCGTVNRVTILCDKYYGTPKGCVSVDMCFYCNGFTLHAKFCWVLCSRSWPCISLVFGIFPKICIG